MEYFRRLFGRLLDSPPPPAPPAAWAPDCLWICLACSYVALAPGPCQHCGTRYVQVLSVRLSALVQPAQWFRSRNAELRERQGLAAVAVPQFLTGAGADNWEVAPGTEHLRVLRQPPKKREKP